MVNKMVDKICKYEIVKAFSCPYCGALILPEQAEETCWSCDREVEFPDEPEGEKNVVS